MKKMGKLTAAFLAMSMCASFTACGGSSGGSTAAPATTDAAPAAASSDASAGGKTVGIAMPTKSLERWNRDGEYLKNEFEAAGYKVELKYSDNDTNQQNNDIQAMIQQGIDLMIKEMA